MTSPAVISLVLVLMTFASAQVQTQQLQGQQFQGQQFQGQQVPLLPQGQSGQFPQTQQFAQMQPQFQQGQQFGSVNPSQTFLPSGPVLPQMSGGIFPAQPQTGFLTSQDFLRSQCRGIMCLTEQGDTYNSCDLIAFGMYNGRVCGPSASPIQNTCAGVTCISQSNPRDFYNSCDLLNHGYDGYTCAPGAYPGILPRSSLPAARSTQAHTHDDCEGIICVSSQSGQVDQLSYSSCDLLPFGFSGKQCGFGFRPHGSCGVDHYGAQCPVGQCCSVNGYCGVAEDYCNAQSQNVSSGYPYNMGSMMGQQQFPQMNNQFPQMNNQFPQMNNQFPQMNNQFPQMNNQFPQMNNQFPQMNNQFPQMNNQFPQMGNQVQGQVEPIPQYQSQPQQYTGNINAAIGYNGQVQQSVPQQQMQPLKV